MSTQPCAHACDGTAVTKQAAIAAATPSRLQAIRTPINEAGGGTVQRRPIRRNSAEGLEACKCFYTNSFRDFVRLAGSQIPVLLGPPARPRHDDPLHTVPVTDA